MAGGVRLGIVLICFVLAERVCCLRAARAQSHRGQNGISYVGPSPRSGGHLQNRLRRPSGQSRGTDAKTAAVGRGFSRGLASSGYTQTLTRPGQSGHTSVRLAQSSSLSRPNWRSTKSNAQEAPKARSAGLSSTITSRSSSSKHNQYQTRPDDGGRRPSPVQQSPPSKWELAAQESHGAAAAEKPSIDGQRRRAPEKSDPQRRLVQMQTSATAPGRRVSPHRSYRPSPSSDRRYGGTRSDGRTEASSYGPSLPVYRGTAHGDLQPQGLVRPTRLGLRDTPGSSRGSSLQPPWSSGNPTQGAHDLPASGSHGGGTSGRHLAPTIIHHIPHRFGGYAIKRLAGPADQRDGRVGRPQQVHRVPPLQASTVPPQRRVSVKPQVQGAHPEAKWQRVRPPWSLKVRPEDVRG